MVDRPGGCLPTGVGPLSTSSASPATSPDRGGGGDAPMMVVPTPATKPRLYRISRNLRWLALAATLSAIVYIIAAVVSIALGPPTLSLGNTGNSGTGFNTCANATTGSGPITVACSFRVTNNASFPLSIQMAVRIAELHGPLVLAGSTSVVTINGKQSAVVDLVISQQNTPSRGAPYVGSLWANGSYAYIVSLSLSVSFNGNFSSANATVAVPVGSLLSPSVVPPEDPWIAARWGP